MKYDIKISISITTATHLLAGLARQYRELSSTAPPIVGAEIRLLMVEILTSLYDDGVNINSARSPFKSYAAFVKIENFITNI